MSSVKSFKKTNFEDEDVSKLQGNLEIFFRPIQNSEIVDGVLLKNISLLAAGTTKVSHKLGRKIQGYAITRLRANSVVWDTQDSNANPTTTLDLNCSADVTVDLWIF